MKKHRLAMLAAGLVLAACADQMQPLSPDPSSDAAFSAAGRQVADAYVPGRVLARFRPGAASQAIAAANGATIQREVTLGIMMLSVPAGAELRVAEALSRNPNVEFAEPDLIRTFGNPLVMPVNDPFIGYKWDLDNDGKLYTSTGSVLATTGKVDADMDWKEAYDHLGGVASGSVIIGILDTGIREDHDDLAGRIAAQRNIFANTAIAADDDGHGTHVAGIAGAAANNGKGVAGVSFGANTRFAIAKVCGPIVSFPFSSYGCPLSAIAEGITWAVNNGANVLNLSLGGTTGSQAEQTALQYARSNNVLPFCAAGNEKSAVSYPAAFPECVAVSATDWGDDLASYSNFGPQVELSAPGGDSEDRKNGYSYILSSYYSSPSSYVFMAGTSMASPQAAGLAALLHALGITDDDAKLQRMITTADDLGTAGRDNRFGHGRINVYRAVTNQTGGTQPPPVNQAPTASFTYSCVNTTCSFDASNSSDDNGIVSYAWNFGDGTSTSGPGVTASRTYASGGTYSVSLTVTDGGGLTAVQTQTVSVTSQSGGFNLTASGFKVKGVQHANLDWSGSSATSFDVYRSGTIIMAGHTGNTYTDNIGAKGGGSYTYRVCEAGTSTCSNTATVTF